MDEVTVKYGDSHLHLIKSKNLIGAKPEAGKTDQVSSLFSSISSTPEPQIKKLGGFQVFDVSCCSEDAEDILDTVRQRSEIRTGTHIFHTSDDEIPFVPTGQLYITGDSYYNSWLWLHSSNGKRC